MAYHIKDHRDGFPEGVTQITTLQDAEHQTGISLASWRLKEGESSQQQLDNETAFLLMSGKALVSIAGKQTQIQRTSLFDDGPSCVHAPQGVTISVVAAQDSEFTVYAVDNKKRFEPRIILPDAVANEARGKGQANNTCLRIVRTIFDDTNSDDNCDLVLGEVITMPGRWSSYPPHHHPQPEIYHYRFAKPQGFGHAELGEDVLKVRHNDTVKIFSPNTHAQCAAPGYEMYYSWVIRHLPNDRYTVPVFLDEHKWIMKPGAKSWLPEGME